MAAIDRWLPHTATDHNRQAPLHYYLSGRTVSGISSPELPNHPLKWSAVQGLRVTVQTEVVVPLAVHLQIFEQQVQGGVISMEMDGGDSTSDVIDGLGIKRLISRQ